MTECLHLVWLHTDAESHGTDLLRAFETGGLCVHHKIKRIMSTYGHVYCCTACDNNSNTLGTPDADLNQIVFRYDKW